MRMFVGELLLNPSRNTKRLETSNFKKKGGFSKEASFFPISRLILPSLFLVLQYCTRNANEIY
jgi:hypothetical protein